MTITTSSSSTLPLPKPSPNAKVTLKLLPSGTIHLPTWMFLSSVSSRTHTLPCPSMSWLIHHEPSDTYLIYDLGLPKDRDALSPFIKQRVQDIIRVDVQEDVYDGLRRLKIDPRFRIDSVIFSHMHYDHVGDPRPLLGGARFVVGHGTRALLTGDKSYPRNADGEYVSEHFPPCYTDELPNPNHPFPADYYRRVGPFPHAHDWFGDGSVWLVDAPGHMAGHLNVLVWSEGSWMLLAADSCHHVRILSGEEETAVYEDPSKPGKMKCAHADKEAAEMHLARLREAMGMGVEVVLAHDGAWFEKEGHRFR